jgi:hypothetical protein
MALNIVLYFGHIFDDLSIVSHVLIWIKDKVGRGLLSMFNMYNHCTDTVLKVYDWLGNENLPRGQQTCRSEIKLSTNFFLIFFFFSLQP